VFPARVGEHMKSYSIAGVDVVDRAGRNEEASGSIGM
jgi:hypothetical protein